MVDAFGEWGWQTLRAGDESEWQLLEKCAQRYGVSHYCLASAEAMRGDLIKGNERLAQVTRTNSLVKGYVVVNPNHLDESAGEMKKYLSEGQFIGIAIPPPRLSHPLGSWRTAEVVKMARRYDVPLLTFLETEKDAEGLLSLVRTFSGLRALAVLLRGCDWWVAFRILSESPNVATIVTGLLTERGVIEQGVALLGDRRVLFGSGMTKVHISRALGMILEADITDRQRQLILEGNARSWLSL
ncbi:MAG: hypothetical protein NZ959_00895 [Armatimonadetes bacterium]|nr:hypothetical protein [Armatimonadota bacterium]MDW8121055.1 hypothetical protein [Armatimonadota bacterium]